MRSGSLRLCSSALPVWVAPLAGIPQRRVTVSGRTALGENDAVGLRGVYYVGAILYQQNGSPAQRLPQPARGVVQLRPACSTATVGVWIKN